MTVEDDGQTGMGLRLVQRPLVAGKELGQGMVLDAQQAEEVAGHGHTPEAGAEDDNGQVIGGAGAAEARGDEDEIMV